MSSRVVPFPASPGEPRRLSVKSPLATLLGRLVMGIGETDRLHRERRYLDEMDDRTLRDIGVTRAEVEAELRQPISWTALLFRG